MGVAAVVVVAVVVVAVVVVVVTLPSGGVVGSPPATTLKVAVAVVLASIASTLTMYWSGLKPVASTSKDHLFAPSPFRTTALPAVLEKPVASVFDPGWNAAEVTSMFSVSPTARFVVPEIVNALPAVWLPIGSIRT